MDRGMVDRAELADFLRRRRESLTPADVGLPPGVRRRTPGLRRDEVSVLAGMSTDYYTRLEQGRGPHPSTQIVASLARALRYSDDERDHLYVLCGHAAPPRLGGTRHVGPGLLFLLDKLDDTPACVISDLGETLVQNRLHKLLTGDFSASTGLDRYYSWRWFTDPSARDRFSTDDWEGMSRKHVADLRARAAQRGANGEAQTLVSALRASSEEFEILWTEHRVAVGVSALKRFVHPDVGLVSVICETLVTQNADQHLLVYIPEPGTDAREKIELLSVIGTQNLLDTQSLPSQSMNESGAPR